MTIQLESDLQAANINADIITANNFIGNVSIIIPAAVGPILGTLPNLYFAPNPTFEDSIVIDGSQSAQLECIRNGQQYTFLGTSSTAIGITSSENLPIIFSSNGFGTKIYIEPTFGNIGIGTTNPNAKLDIVSQSIIIEQSFTPLSSSSGGFTGQIAWDSNFIYVCVANNTWKRATLGTF